MTGKQTTSRNVMIKRDRQFDAIVIGLGKTGLSCVRLLVKQGLTLAVVDSRNTPPELDKLRHEYPDVPVYCGPFDPLLLRSARLLVISPGVSQQEPAIQQALMTGIEIVGDIELFARYAQAPIIAITGSNGKSTVVSLLNHLINEAGLKSALGGNIGLPALSFLEMEIPDFYVLELSSFQLETVRSLNAIAAVVLNISADHMDRYQGIDDYSHAKETIYAGTGIMILNDDDHRVAAMEHPGRKTIHYSTGHAGTADFGLKVVEKEDWLCGYGHPLLPASELKLKGRHNLSNTLAALALGSSIGLQMESMISALKGFSGLPHRCEWIANINGVDWFNDSKGTNPGATCAAIEGLSTGNDIVLIAGGMAKGADFTLLANSVVDRVHTAVLIGKDAGKIAASLEGATTILFVTSLESAVNVAANQARPHDTVLLSPACASFDMFRDYQHRGEVFRQAVSQLGNAEKVNA